MHPSTALLLLKLLDLAVLGVRVTPAAIASYNAARAKIATMIAEGRGPTPEETAEIDGHIDAMRAELHAAPASPPA